MAMQAYADRFPAQLSAAAAARGVGPALITEPRILLLDEPLSALDPFLRVQMRVELKRLQRELGSPSSTSPTPRTRPWRWPTWWCDERGRIEQHGSPREVFNHPRTEFVARFIGGHNVVTIGGVRLAVRADRLRLCRLDGDADACGRLTAS